VSAADVDAGWFARTLLGLYLFVVGGVTLCILVAVFPSAETRVLNAPLKESSPVAGQPGGPAESLPADSTSGAATESSARWLKLDELQFGEWSVLGRILIPARLNPERGLMLLALLAGILGSFLHAAQSFAAYVGNRQLKTSWVWWYVMRPPIGAVLGLVFYFVVRAGFLTASTTSVSPYGVVTFGALAGWFSKQATDKLAELFETLFRTSKPAEYKDKLTAGAPRITRVDPSRVPASEADVVLTVVGEHFLPGAKVRLGQVELVAEFSGANQLVATVSAGKRPPAGEVEITVVNPGPVAAPSLPFKITFE
jgi:hypothetical protein